MKSSCKSPISIVLFGLFFVYVSIASAGVPNTFTAGAVAKSSDVNTNFNFVNYGNIVVKSNGVEIGTLLMHDIAWNGLIVLTPQGYSVAINPDGSLRIFSIPVYYTTTNCSGTPYLDITWPTFPGDVIQPTTGTLYYVSKTAVPIPNLTYNSNDTNGSCTQNSPLPGMTANQLTPNDPLVTGVSSSGYTPPITIERR